MAVSPNMPAAMATCWPSAAAWSANRPSRAPSQHQSRSQLHPDQSLAAAVTDGSGDTVMVAGKPRHVMNYLQDFLFTPSQARTPVKVLSGGERARLLLAKLFATPSNFLVLDEPTNDLDLETLDLLEEVIAD